MGFALKVGGATEDAVEAFAGWSEVGEMGEAAKKAVWYAVKGGKKDKRGDTALDGENEVTGYRDYAAQTAFSSLHAV